MKTFSVLLCVFKRKLRISVDGPESEILRNNYLVIACIKGVVNTGSSTDDKLETWKVTFTSSQVSCENKRQLYTYG